MPRKRRTHPDIPIFLFSVLIVAVLYTNQSMIIHDMIIHDHQKEKTKN